MLIQHLIGEPVGSLPFVYVAKGVAARFKDELMGQALAGLRDALLDSLEVAPDLGRVRGRTVLRAASIIEVSPQRIAIFPQPTEKPDN